MSERTAGEVADWLDGNDGRLEDLFALWTQGKRSSRWIAEQLIDEGYLRQLDAMVHTDSPADHGTGGHVKPDFTVEERAARYQRRYTGPWKTVTREVGPVDVTYRYRRRRKIEWARLDVAGHDLWVHAVWRGAVVPVVEPIVRWLARHLPTP